MMTRTRKLEARAGAAAIAAVLALSPTYAASPKPVVDLSASPAISGKAETPAQAKTAPPARKIGPVDERTVEIGGGALAILILGGAALAMRSRKRRREHEEAWQYDSPEAEAAVPASAEEQPAIVAPPASAFAWGATPRHDSVTASGSRKPGESWVQRARRGPTPDNPSLSLKKRLKRAAFFDQREREVAAGEAEPVDADAGLPENVDKPERHLEAA